MAALPPNIKHTDYLIYNDFTTNSFNKIVIPIPAIKVDKTLQKAVKMHI